ncbi:MAG TPA: hypothetical protein VIS06_14260, partial [Mycobacteriales bacterium]
MEDAAGPSGWAFRLAKARLRRFPTMWQAARALHSLDPKNLPDAKTLHRYWSERWEPGAIRPNRTYRELIERLLDAPGLFRDSAVSDVNSSSAPELSDLPVQSGRPDISPMPTCRHSLVENDLTTRPVRGEEVRMAADESAEHAMMSDAQIGESTLEQLRGDVLRIARGYSLRPLPDVFRAARQTRDIAMRLIDRTHRLAQLADLYVITGQSCGLLATAAFEMGYWDAAARFAGSAHTYGDLAGHKGLRAWALGLHAIIANWQGHPDEALNLLGDGLRQAPAGTATVRLRCIEARSRSLLADRDGTTSALHTAEQARTTDFRDDLHDEIGGEFGFGAARQAFCAGSAYIGLRDGAAAEEHAQRALTLYASAPAGERAYSAENGARIDLGTARLLRGDLDGAREALAPVLALPPVHRVVVLTGRLGQARTLLAGEAFTGSRVARQLDGEIHQFSADTAARALP